MDWSAADVLYFSNLCFDDPFIEKVADLSQKMKSGSRIIALKELPERPYLEVKAALGIRMSWGVQKTWVYHKI